MNKTQYQALKRIIKIANNNGLEIYNDAGDKVDNRNSSRDELENTEYLNLWFPTKINLQETK